MCKKKMIIYLKVDHVLIFLFFLSWFSLFFKNINNFNKKLVSLSVPFFFGAPWRIRTSNPRFRNGRDSHSTLHRFTSFCYFTIVILQRVYEKWLEVSLTYS